MISVLTGENSFAIREALSGIIAAAGVEPERIDGATLELRQLPDLLMGGTLFADKRLVVINGLSKNLAVWEGLGDWLPRISVDIHVVLIDEKLDKRRLSYKALSSVTKIQEFHPWGERDEGLAVSWTQEYAKKQGIELGRPLAQLLVRRTGLDEWQIASALEKLALADTIDQQTIENLVDASPTENVFILFETALSGRRDEVHRMIRTLELTEDPHQLFALLCSQAFSLSGVASAAAGDSPSKDLAIHPFVASKLAGHAKKYGRGGAHRILRMFAKADADLKRSRGEPWLIIEKVLLSI